MTQQELINLWDKTSEKYENLVKSENYRVLRKNILFSEQVTEENMNYVIYNDFEIEDDFTMPANCTLFFCNGKLSGVLRGNRTFIQARPIQIFDENIIMEGTFINDVAYPEWWGAVAEVKDTGSDLEEHNFTNSRAAIQAALDSPFYEIHFLPGMYYVADAVDRPNHDRALLYMDRAKVLKLAGEGGYYKVFRYGSTTVIWTDQNENLLMLYILSDKFTFEYSPNTTGANYTTVIDGGMFNIVRCPEYNKAAILLCPRSRSDIRLHTSLNGVIGGVHSTNPNNWNKTGYYELHVPTKQEINNGYKGYGIRIKENTSEPETMWKKDDERGLIGTRGTFFLGKIDCKVYGFGHGFCCDYDDVRANVTSLDLSGYFDNCLRYIYAPSQAFGGGSITPIIQTRQINSQKGFSEAVIQGDLEGCYLNPFIWDIDNINILNIKPSKNISFGNRILPLLNDPYNNSGLQRIFPRNRIWDETANHEEPTFESNTDWDTNVLAAAAIIASGDYATAGSFGKYDKNALSASNANNSTFDYIHTIDNDLLSLDSVENGYTINTYYSDNFKPLTGNDSIVVPNTSPFDKNGMVFKWNDTSTNGGELKVEIQFPSNSQKKLQFLAIHLKGVKYTYFENLKLDLEYEKIDTNGHRWHEILFNGSYTQLSRKNGAGLWDIILPFFFRPNIFNSTTGTYDQISSGRRVKCITLTFSNLKQTVDISSSPKETFKFSIEGQFNKRYNKQVFTSDGGALGKDITRLGSPYILGTKVYNKISELPSNASLGAIGLITVSNNLAYPIIKTSQGWILQYLINTTQGLSTLNASIGPLTKGQSAFDTTLNIPVWWNGTGWIGTSEDSLTTTQINNICS